ncbi:MAG: protein-disulfide reductase DsbD family protein [Alphaproteobacteria bacterium]
MRFKFGKYWLQYFLLLTAITALFAPQVLAQSSSEPDNYVAFRVLAERNAVSGGEEIWVGVEQSIYPEWHTYWQNPGDSGSAPRHNWSLPEGFEIGPIHWPVPKKIPYDTLLNYGYSGSVMLMQKLKLPETLPEGPITLSVDAEALVCKDICIPEYGTFDLVLNDPDNPGEDNSEYFEKALEKEPQSVQWPAEYGVNGDLFELRISPPQDFLANIDQNNLSFLPVDWGVVENAAPATVTIKEEQILISQALGERDLSSLGSIQGVLAYQSLAGEYKGVQFQASPSLGGAAKQSSASQPSKNLAETSISEKDKVAATGLFTAIILAVLGGLILNLMPCVFPVLSLKALSLVKISEKDASLARLHGLSYTAGIILSFLLIAAVLIILQAGGQHIGWGFQLQNPVIISLLAYLLFVIGLNLAGFFEISNTFGNAGQKLTQGQGLSSSFFTGVLATIVATPCTAPFMGVAIGYALLQPSYIALAIFAALGFGLALPYLLLAFAPPLQKFMPKPGAWMETFKQFLAFPMFVFAVWLVWILAQQTGSFGVLSILLGMVFIAFALWLKKITPKKSKGVQYFIAALIIISVLAAFSVIPTKTLPPAMQKQAAQNVELTYKDFSPDSLQAALEGQNPVFVEMTAAWCITCKVNHASSINRASTIHLFEEQNVEYFVGDWTNYDSDITDYLSEFGRNGVPIYVFYGAPDPATNLRPEPVVLPQILTPAIVADTVGGTA